MHSDAQVYMKIIDDDILIVQFTVKLPILCTALLFNIICYDKKFLVNILHAASSISSK